MSIAVANTGEYAYTLTEPVTGTPLTISVWFKVPDITVNYAAMAIDIPISSGYQILAALEASGGVGGDPVRAYNYNGSSYGIAASTTGYASGTWVHACGKFTSATSRDAFIDGGDKGSNSDNVVGVPSELVICRRRRNSAVGSFPAGSYIAEVAVWDVALSDANIALLAGGSNPLNVDGSNLIAYWPLTTVTTNTDSKGSNDLTESTTLTYSADHPTIAAPDPITHVTATLSGLGAIELSPLTVTHHLSKTTLAGLGTIIPTANITNVNLLGHPLSDPAKMTVPGWTSNAGSAIIWPGVAPREVVAVDSGSRTQVDGVPAEQQKHTGSGVAEGAGQLWFEMGHLIPRLVQDVGNLISDQTINCDLYNADRKNAITVSSVSNDLGIGYTVTGVPATPFNIESQESLDFSIKVLRTGDLIIDGSYTFTLSTGETYTIYVVGSRIVLFPVRPEAPLREHLIFDTRIIEAVDGSEQRIANRQYPRGMFEATYKAGQRKVEMILFDRQAKIVAWPAWHQPAFMDGAHSVDDLTVNVNTTNYSNFYVGGYAVILQDENIYDALKIESMTATSLTFDSGLRYNYASKTEVMPLLTAYVEASTASLKYPYNQQYFNTRIHVHAEVNDIADASAWSQYDGKPFMDGANLITGGQLAEALRTKVFVIDNLTGLRTQVSAWGHNKRYSKKGWKTNTRQELWELYQLLYFLKGRQVSFYIPTFWKDLVPNQQMLISTFTLNMDHIGYVVNAQERWPKQFIRVVLKNGSILIREILSSVEVSETQEQLTLDVAWPATYQPEDIERIEFLEKVRLDLDDIVLIHYNALGQCECVVPIKEVDN